jgi:putative SOS response-associated peptidase YedK
LAGCRPSCRGRFGLIPHWAKEDKIGRHTYNARRETVAQKASFCDPWPKGQRCIIPMDAFYEPNWENGKAVRWRVQLASAQPFGVAGLWAWWRAPNGAEVHSARY